MTQKICKNCGEYEGHHGSDGCCPSAKDYGKKFEEKIGYTRKELADMGMPPVDYEEPKKPTEFNLSEKIRYGELDSYAFPEDWIQKKDIKTFIKKLKEEIDRLSYSKKEIETFEVTEQQRIGFNLGVFSVRDEIDNLAGEELSK